MNKENDLLKFAESIANNSSGNLHGFYPNMIIEARQLVKKYGGELRKIGRFEKDSAAWRPYEKYINGKWIHPKLNKKLDQWEFPARI